MENLPRHCLQRVQHIPRLVRAYKTRVDDKSCISRRYSRVSRWNLIFLSIYVDLSTMTRFRRSSAPTLSLLSAMLERPRAWQHGYELAQITGLKSGTLYPILM